MKRQKLFIIFPLLILIVILGAAACSAEPETIYVTEVVLKEVEVDGETVIVTQIVEVQPEAEMPLDYDNYDTGMDPDPGSGKTGNDYAANRLIIMNAEVSIIVDDPASKADQITQMTTAMGGWVVQSNVYALETETKRIFNAQITVRVPAERLNEALDIIKEDAIEIVYDNKSGEDVTEDYTDTESRLRNLQETADKLREILESAQDTDEALDVLEELTEITEEIEVLEGKLQYYSEAAAMSSITVSLEAPLELFTPTPTMTPTPTQAPTNAIWKAGETARSSLTRLGNFLQNFADFLIRFVLLWLPILLILILPVALFLWLVSVIRRRRMQKKQAAQKDEAVDYQSE